MNVNGATTASAVAPRTRRADIECPLTGLSFSRSHPVILRPTRMPRLARIRELGGCPLRVFLASHVDDAGPVETPQVRRFQPSRARLYLAARTAARCTSNAHDLRANSTLHTGAITGRRNTVSVRISYPAV